MGDLRELSVGVSEERPVPSPSSSLIPNPKSIGAERWVRAEEATQKIICHVQPTCVSEERRRGVIDYVQRLIRNYLRCEVFPFGSVPLKTYLPDGDIDLTAFGGANVEDALVDSVVSVLEGEDQNRAAEFIVKDIQLIRAEVDQLIGKDHLFKRSIILTKAWCYYESRILGAHHGLISTYALETLVLYIFNLFHSTLNGPLAVLYTFLDYFSKFDWDNYCICLTGPVRVSSLPAVVAETPDNGGNDLFLSNDFLRDCVDMFSVPSRGVDINSRTFPPKHLNIVDPLKKNNNLGRSVSKGNFYRIRSAFTYGARKLGRILLLPDNKITDELHKFFSNTLDRHGSGQRPDVQDPVPMSGHNGFGPALSFSETESCQEDKAIPEFRPTNSIGVTGDFKLDTDWSSQNGGNNSKVSGMEIKMTRTTSGQANGQQKGSKEVVHSTSLSEAEGSVHGTAVLGYRVSGDAEDLATSRIRGLNISNDSLKSAAPSGEESISMLGAAHHAPHLYFSGSKMGNGEMKYGDSDPEELEYSDSTVNKFSSGLLQAHDERTGISDGCDQDKNQLVGNHEVLTSVIPKDIYSVSTVAACLEDIHPGYRFSAGTAGGDEYLNSLSDLTGDYESHFNSMQYGRWLYESTFNSPTLPMPSPMPSQFHGKNSWHTIWNSSQVKRNGFSHTNANGIIPRPMLYPMNTLLIPGPAFGVEEMPKPRGTGTYFPNTNRLPHHKPSTPRGRNQAQVRSPRNNGRAVTPMEANLLERSNHEVPQAQFRVDQSAGKSGSSEIHQSVSLGAKVHSNVNGHIPLLAPLSESTRQPNPASSLAQASSQSLLSPGTQRPKPVLVMNQDRVTLRSSYHLKDEDDFPPLSV
ncbi:uncharacterized protein LOC132286427 isoform X2 [Cornus florida]|uniref:uncharacterized protein LOC132286427 isoform X2 n=1 Tax=Cornus florida TaxID=4283 RepID=UPI0028982C25|nr:uncharacterized protein LOC132286427 isoform X2 [Cornus florida]